LEVTDIWLHTFILTKSQNFTIKNASNKQTQEMRTNTETIQLPLTLL